MINTLLICLIGWICFVMAKDGTAALADQRKKIAYLSKLVGVLTEEMEEYDRKLEKTTQIALNAQNKATANSKRLDRSVVYEKPL